jgi:predicted DNA-binding antitoxin AbrB/MazE fold protein
MTIEATYRDGAFYPTMPISLPENTRVEVRLPTEARKLRTPEEMLDARPRSPKITSEEFRARIAKYAIRVGTLPADFSRADIYSDHD